MNHPNDTNVSQAKRCPPSVCRQLKRPTKTSAMAMSFYSPTLIITDEDHLDESFALLPLIDPRRSPLAISSYQGQPFSSVRDSSTMFRLRLHVDGFHAEDLDLHLDPGRLIVRGRHCLRCPNDLDPSGDFVSKEFQRTFRLPMSLDIHKALAEFYPTEEILLVEIPFQRLPQRPMDIFLTIVTILFIDRALRVTYEEYLRANGH